MAGFNRRNFLQSSGLALVPALLPFQRVFGRQPEASPAPVPVVKLFGDGEMFEPEAYLGLMQEIQASRPIGKDRYGSGGAVEALEKKFMEITGKEQAIFMPSGTMANQLAISVLSGEKTKVFVQETSHVYRDEADAAQTVFRKRLMPLAAGQAYFTAGQLQQAIESLRADEAFDTGIGAVSIENPVRRADGRMLPIEEIRKISEYCRGKGIGLHLDGARLYMASAWSGIPIRLYASYFDTVYISLYKYLGASAGAMLCGDRAVIGRMPHLIKTHGGNMYSNWTNAAMALHRLEGFENRLQSARKRSEEVFAALNRLDGIRVESLESGTNIFRLKLPAQVDGKKFQETLNRQFHIRMPMPGSGNQVMIGVNETILYRETDYLLQAFRKSLQAS